MRDVELNDFKPLVGERFSVEGSDRSVILAEAKAFGHGEREGGAFSLVFVAEEGIEIGQGTLRLNFDGRSFDLFLIPIGPFGDGHGLEAVFT